MRYRNPAPFPVLAAARYGFAGAVMQGGLSPVAIAGGLPVHFDPLDRPDSTGTDAGSQ